MVTNRCLVLFFHHIALCFVDKLTDKFDATPPCEAPYCRLHDTLDFVPQHLAMFDDFLFVGSSSMLSYESVEVLRDFCGTAWFSVLKRLCSFLWMSFL